MLHAYASHSHILTLGDYCKSCNVNEVLINLPEFIFMKNLTSGFLESMKRQYDKLLTMILPKLHLTLFEFKSEFCVILFSLFIQLKFHRRLMALSSAILVYFTSDEKKKYTI